MLKLTWRSLTRSKLRSALTVFVMAVAIWVLCFLRSAVTTMEAGIVNASATRLWVQSAVSLFVSLPPAYQPKIEQVEGVADTCKWQWFGGYYKDPSNFFAQFAVDRPELLSMWPEIEVIEGSTEKFLSQRDACIIGDGLAQEFDWKVGDKIPLIGALFPKANGDPWTFEVAAVYRPTKPVVDNRTLFFAFELFEETFKAENGGATPPVGTIAILTHPNANLDDVMGTVTEMFANGPQRVQTITESEFNRQFVNMIGNVPKLLGSIGIVVLAAMLFAVINTMLMSAREQVSDVGVLKALGFSNASVFGLLMSQSVLLCALGGALGVLLATGMSAGIEAAIGKFFPGYRVLPSTMAMAAGVTAVVGLVAGIVPAWNATRVRVVDILRREV